MRAIITVGLGFGDEGKGATVDFLTRRHNADWVVRYSGGAQAGHNVELPDGRRHTFSQFGAGTLAGAQTYLGPRVIINPSTLIPEAEHLEELGIVNPSSLLTVHPSCLISSIYHVAMNRLRERARGDRRHGSCGLGVGETRAYWLQNGKDAIVAADLGHRTRLIEKLRLLRDRMLLEMQPLEVDDPELMEMLYDTAPEVEADLMIDAMGKVSRSDEFPRARLAVFEGSQGVLLDEYHGFHPYTTWSTVTTKHAFEIVNDAGIERVETLGLTRAYATRHGAGPFPTRCSKMSKKIVDLGNPENDWQGAIQAGPLDLVLLRYACHVNRVDGLVVNHLDELPDKVQMCLRYECGDRLDVPRRISDQQRLTERLEEATPVIEETDRDGLLQELSRLARIRIVGEGPCHQDRTFEPSGLF